MMEVLLEADVFAIPYLSFIGGLFFCLMGRKLLGLIVIVFGFLIGYGWLTSLLGGILGIAPETSKWLPPVAGLLGAVLGLIAWRVSVFFAGTVVGLFVVRGFLPELPGLAHVAAALACGTLTHLFKDRIISLLTAIAGAYVAAGSAMILLDRIDFIDSLAGFIHVDDPGPGIGIGLVLIFAIVGYKFQVRNLGA